MKKMILYFFTALLFAAGLNAYAAQPNPLIGEWKYEATMAPEGYSSGVLEFSENNNKLTGKLRLSGDYTVNLQQLTLDNNELQFSLYIDGYYISVDAKIEDDELAGTADTPDGEIAFTAKKMQQQ